MQLLKEQDIFPTNEVLANTLGNLYPIFEKFTNTITNSKFSLIPEWRYYNDGKAWLCKVCYKKKTMFWLSIWENFFKVTFYFTEKNTDIEQLNIDAKIKNNFKNSKRIGKLIPLIIDVDDEKQLNDILQIIEYKKNFK